MRNSALAKRYARAFLEAAASTATAVKTVEEMHAFLRHVDECDDFRHLLYNPTFNRERVEVVLKVIEKMQLSKFTQSVLLLIIGNDRIHALNDITETLASAIEEKDGAFRATITSAIALSDTQKSQLKSELEKISGKKLMLETEVDPGILGGVVARLGSLVYDGSVRAQLRRMEELLAKEV